MCEIGVNELHSLKKTGNWWSIFKFEYTQVDWENAFSQENDFKFTRKFPIKKVAKKIDEF